MPHPLAWSAPQEIEDLLHRRGDLSTFLVHLTRDGAQSARQNLLAILREQKMEARSAFGPAAEVLRGTKHEDSQKAVCFTETPLEHTWMMCQPITGRTIKLAGYGLAFAKDWARRKGANPVWYMDITPGHDWLTHAADALIKAGRAEPVPAFLQPGSSSLPEIFRLTPFWEQMGTGTRSDGQSYRKEFSWEREWRFVGDLAFTLNEVVAVFVPENDHHAFSDEASQAGHHSPLPALLDPAWSLEKMILALRHQG